MRKLLFVLLLVGVICTRAGANTIAANSCSRADVNTAIGQASAGDTVLVPAGAACDWTAGISFSGISVIGAGSSSSGTVITAGAVTITKHATHLTRMSGFRFTDTNVHLTVNGGTYPFRVDHNYFNMNASNFVITFFTNGGVVDHNTFDGPPSTGCNPNNGCTDNADVMGIHADDTNAWNNATTFGTADTNGTINVYFEDNTFNELLAALDCDDGSRLVFRHNQVNSSGIVMHGTKPADSTDLSTGGGCRQAEFYNNTFHILNAADDNIPQGWIWFRGASGVVANNTMDSTSTSNFSCGGTCPNINLTLACPQAYPVPYQTGQSAVTASETENPPSHPVLIFGNTGAGTSISVGSSDTAGGSCSNPGNYIQLNRDYYASNRWNWVPYTYPHPLVSSIVPPTNLAATVQ